MRLSEPPTRAANRVGRMYESYEARDDPSAPGTPH